jgi:hypothetical protein
MDDCQNRELKELPVPPFVVLYRNQEGAIDKVTPEIDAMFRDKKAAHRHLNMYRPLGEHEFLTLEEVDTLTGQSTVHSALTAKTMRMVITDHGPRAMPREMAALWDQECDDPECGCHEEGDDE